MKAATSGSGDHSSDGRQDDSDAILAARADKLMRRLSSGGDQTTDEDHLAVVEFKLAREKYAVALEYTQEVCPINNVTPLPGTPPFVLGIISHKGRIVSILDFHSFFGLEPNGSNDRRRALVLHGGPSGAPMVFGVAVDAVIGSRLIPESRIQPAPTTLNGPKSHYIMGVGPGGVVLLDGRKILTDQDLIIDQESLA